MSLASCADCSAAYPAELVACPQCRSTRRGGGAVLPTVALACRTDGCRYLGVGRRVLLRMAVPGVLELPRYLCAGCRAELAAWRTIGEEDMPRIHADREPTYAADIPAEGDVGPRAAPIEPIGQANAMAAENGDLFFPDNAEDALFFRREHGARPVNPEAFAVLFLGIDLEAEASATTPPDYGALTVDELRAELAARELATTGRKAELVARLQESDAAQLAILAGSITLTVEAEVTRPDGSKA